MDRLQFVAKDEVELLGQFRQDYDRFVEIVTQVRGIDSRPPCRGGTGDASNKGYTPGRPS